MGGTYFVFSHGLELDFKDALPEWMNEVKSRDLNEIYEKTCTYFEITK